MRPEVKMQRPCEDCPFRTNKPLYLRAARAAEIAHALKTDRSFACHKTCDYSDDGGDDSNAAFCAGAVGTMVNANEHFSNVLIRLMVMGTKPDEHTWPQTIERHDLFDGLDEWVDAHWLEEEEE